MDFSQFQEVYSTSSYTLLQWLSGSGISVCHADAKTSGFVEQEGFAPLQFSTYNGTVYVESVLGVTWY